MDRKACNMQKYLQILEESLKKKNALLDKILASSKKQEVLLNDEKLKLEEFDTLVDEKDQFVDELTKLDEGFETLFQNVKAELDGNKSLYKEEIGRMQKQITDITEKSVQIQALEARNKVALENHFRKERNSLRTGRQSSTAAYNYYKNMSYGNIPAPSVLDEKN